MRNFKSAVFIVLSLLVTAGILFGPVSISQAQSIQNWSDPVNLSNSGSASDPLLVVDGRGILHVLWIDEFDGYKYSASSDGSTWSDPKIVRYPFSPDDFQPVFLVDPRGPIYMFWLTEENDLRYAQSLPANLSNPGAWGPVITLGTSIYDFDVALDLESGFHVDYIRNPVSPATGPAGVYYRRSQSGSAWSTPVVLYESQYFRSIDHENAHVRIEVSNGSVYAVWDDRSLKRVFMAKSNDSGIGWNAPVELIVPQANLGFKTPINIEIGKFNNNILLMWQVVDPGIRCTKFSQWSADGGENWTEPVKMFGEFITCPDKSEILFVTQDYVMALFNIQGNLSLIAWNGEAWSIPDVQGGLSIMSNPKTFDLISFGCQQVVHHENVLFAAGCDRGGGGDIWFTSRPLDPMEILFPLPSDWSIKKDVTVVSQQISSLSSVADRENNVHALWVQSASSEADSFEPMILYARWNGNEWTMPVPIMTNLNGLPLNLSLQINSNQRLFLSWVNQQTGELMFSWSNSERANIPQEWSQLATLSASSKLTNSPDMLVDALDRIVIAYAITLNEERGIYLIQSTDLGATWSPPVRVFDAVSAGWEMVDQPRITVTEDGRLHALFTRYSLLGGQQPSGLYYSQSADGGTTWMDPEVVVEQSVPWSEIAAHKGVLHRFWQEKNKAVISTHHQFSSDNGITWSLPASLPGDSVTDSAPIVSLDLNGGLHLLQVEQGEIATLREWGWIGQRWQLSETRKIGIPNPESRVAIDGGITSRGVMYALIQIENPLAEEGTETRLLNIKRSLGLTEPAQPFSVSISTPSVGSLPTAFPEIQAIPTTQPLPLANLKDPQSPMIRNMVGLALILLVVFLIQVFILPRKSKTAARPKKSD